MKLLIKPNKRYSLDVIEKIFTRLISRKGYSVLTWMKPNKTWYSVKDLKQIDQDTIKTLVITECEHYGLEYEIND
jgi:hypothetical protein